jgi:hypothetical protein
MSSATIRRPRRIRDRSHTIPAAEFESSFRRLRLIGSALRPAAAAPAEEIAEPEHVAEDVGEVAELVEHGRIEPCASTCGGANALMTEAIVQTPFFGVAQDGVRLGRFLETILGNLVARVSVWVVLHRELAIRALQLAVGGRSRDGQHFVVVAFAHAFATFTIAGRRRRSPIVYPRLNSSMTSPSRRPGLSSCTTA